MLPVKRAVFVGIFILSTTWSNAGGLSYSNIPVIAPAPASSIDRDDYMLSVQLENDFFSGVDGNYTNGTRFDFISQSYTGFEKPHEHLCGNATSSYIATGLGTLLGGTNASPGWSRFCGMERTEALRQQWSLSLTQFMFTPEHKTGSPLYGERTYAGYLGVGVGCIVKNEDRANSFELQLGSTGDPSLTRNTQHFIHKTLGMEQWPGWNNHLPSEFTFCFFFKRYYRLRFLEYETQSGRFETDGFAYWHADLGTLYLRGGGGTVFRFGYNLPASSSELAISGATFPTSPFAKKRKFPSNWSYYGFAGATCRYVGRDIFLDGPVFHHYPNYVDKFPFVGDVSIGVALRHKRMELIFGYFVRTKEYHTQESVQMIGSVQFRYSF